MVIEEQAVTMCYISKEEENQEVTGFTSVHYNNCSIRIPKKKLLDKNILYFILFFFTNSEALQFLDSSYFLITKPKKKKKFGAVQVRSGSRNLERVM